VAYDDDLQHFMQDAWHLKDWIKNDSSLSIRGDIEALVKERKPLMICADLANGSKHLARDDRNYRTGAYVTSTSVTISLSQGVSAKISYVVTLGDGTQLPIDSLVRDVWADWNDLLANLGLL
jgi:hypothetical protein